MEGDPVRRSRIEIIAHRGYSARAPENTVVAISMALEAGASALEWDLHTAACGTPVLFHDAMLGRTTNGVGPTRRRPVDQLQALDAGKWFSPEFAGERIPTQAEALEHVGDREVRLYQDVKGYREMEDLDRMISITQAAGLLPNTTFLCDDWIVLNRLRHSAPETELGCIISDPDRFQIALDRAVLDDNIFLDLDAGLALEDPSLIATAVDEGLEVGVWTVDDPGVAQSFFKQGVTRFTTNEVHLLLEWEAGIG